MVIKKNNIVLVRLTAYSTVVALLLVALFGLSKNSVSAHSSPVGCTGSGLQISLFTSAAQAHIGDTISFSVTVYNGISSGPIVCDASGITASLVTPDGQSHPITLVRTALTAGQSDIYTNVVTYVVRSQDVNASGALTVTARDTGAIHQNDTDSQGGGNQGVNITVTIPPTLATLHVIKTVVNTHGGIAIPSHFMIHVMRSGVDIAGSPAAGSVAPGTAYSVLPDIYLVSEVADSGYTSSFTGDCNSTGRIVLAAGDNMVCTVINTDVPAVVVPPVATTTPVVVPPVFSSTGGGGGSTPTPLPTILIATTTVPIDATVVMPVAVTPAMYASVIVPSFPNTGFPPEDVLTN